MMGKVGTQEVLGSGYSLTYRDIWLNVSTNQYGCTNMYQLEINGSQLKNSIFRIFLRGTEPKYWKYYVYYDSYCENS